MFGLAIKSMRNRKFTVGLTIVSIALSVALLLGVERIRKEAQTEKAASTMKASSSEVPPSSVATLTSCGRSSVNGMVLKRGVSI